MKGVKNLFLGIIFGFILGILFAPKKGSETREDIKEKYNEFKENPLEAIEETLDKVIKKISEFAFDDINDCEDRIKEEDIVITKSFDLDGEEA